MHTRFIETKSHQLICPICFFEAWIEDVYNTVLDYDFCSNDYVVSCDNCGYYEYYSPYYNHPKNSNYSEIIMSRLTLPPLTLHYFKASGKFYAEGKLDLEVDEVKLEDGSPPLVLMYKVCDRLRELNNKGELPGLSYSKWLNEGYIYVRHPEGYPCLLTP